MIAVAANITLLDWKLPLIDRVAEASRRGLDGVECLFPYNVPRSEWRTALDRAGQRAALINTPEPDWDTGGRGCAALPGLTAHFRKQFFEARSYAQEMGCKCIHVMSGLTEGPAAFDTLIENLRLAASWAPNFLLTIEPLNKQDMPGYFLNDFDVAARVLDAVAMPNVGLQFDSWHAARIHGDPRTVWAAHSERVVHVQIAGLSNRGAPDMRNPVEAGLLRDIARSGYDSWISAEFRPQPGDPTDWLPAVRETLSGDLAEP